VKRALVTGDAGFVGRHMSAALERRGWQVTGCDLKTGGDCRELFLADSGVYDLTVHCAYHVGGRRAIDGEPRNLARNLELDAQLFDWAVRTGQRAVLYFSSSAAYPVRLQTVDTWAPPRHFRHLVEDDIDLPHGPDAGDWTPDARYGWAKLTGEHLAQSAAECGLRVHTVRPFSGYGEDQDLTYPFPAIVARAHAHTPGEPFTVWGPPGQTRDWIHIDDVVAGALAVVDADERRPVNLCTGIGVEFGQLATAILAHVNKTGVVVYDPTKPAGVLWRVGDPTRMLTHHTPTISVAEGIARTVHALAARS
jgi:nucleoside-diphosphate-sugar epimerase